MFSAPAPNHTLCNEWDSGKCEERAFSTLPARWTEKPGGVWSFHMKSRVGENQVYIINLYPHIHGCPSVDTGIQLCLHHSVLWLAEGYGPKIHFIPSPKWMQNWVTLKIVINSCVMCYCTRTVWCDHFYDLRSNILLKMYFSRGTKKKREVSEVKSEVSEVSHEYVFCKCLIFSISLPKMYSLHSCTPTARLLEKLLSLNTGRAAIGKYFWRSCFVNQASCTLLLLCALQQGLSFFSTLQHRHLGGFGAIFKAHMKEFVLKGNLFQSEHFLRVSWLHDSLQPMPFLIRMVNV